MKLLDARVNGSPRQVNTKYGEKSVLDVSTHEGEFTIWRPANDRDVMGRVNGERVKIAIDSKGKVSLVEHCSSAPQIATQEQAVGFNVDERAEIPETCRSAEIADYIQRLGKLYGHCLTTAANMPMAIELDAPQVKDIATTLFIRAAR
jgi:hypothetical protein